MRYKQVVVIGSGDDIVNTSYAYEIGKYIAKKKWVLISGGRSGIMEAASRGAYEEKGIVVGILPYTDHDGSNEYCNIVIPTGIGFARNMINVLSGDVIIAIGGKSGTLSELAYSWHFNKPVILCTFTGGWSNRLSGEAIDDRTTDLFYTALNLEEVFLHLDRILK
jgi:uncharacterized protein (TIGR00725 family)